MAKRRRKLSKEYENSISIASKEVELLLAKIHDIYDDDIRLEYSTAFYSVKSKLDYIEQTYKSIGFNEDSDTLMLIYKKALENFTSEYEI